MDSEQTRSEFTGAKYSTLSLEQVVSTMIRAGRRDGACTMDWVLGQAQGQVLGCVCMYGWSYSATQKSEKRRFFKQGKGG